MDSYRPAEGVAIRRIHVNFRLGNLIFDDEFDWDINNPDNSPEDFAAVIVTDLGLSTEFLLPISHSIRKQVLEHQKQLQVDRRFNYHKEPEFTSETVLRQCATPLMESKEVTGRGGLFTNQAPQTFTNQQNPKLKYISWEEVAKYEKQE